MTPALPPRVIHCVDVDESPEYSPALSDVSHQPREIREMHIRAVFTIEGLVGSVDPADVPHEGCPQPEMHVSSVRLSGIVPTGCAHKFCPHHHLGAGDD